MNKKLILIIAVIFNVLQLYASDKNDPNAPKSSYPDEGIFTGTREINLITNPGFENHTSKWTLGKYDGGSGLFTIDTTTIISGKQSALIHSENQDGDYHDLQLFTFLPLKHQTRYSISFQADVKTTSLISISIGNGFETLFEEKFLLRPGIKHYGPFVFNCVEDDPFSYFAFNLGKTNNKMRFDDIMIQADHTEREFNEVIANTGINVHYNTSSTENSIFISSPRETNTDLPIILYDQNNNVIFTNKLFKGYNEANIKLDKELSKGNYQLKVFTPDKIEYFRFEVN